VSELHQRHDLEIRKLIVQSETDRPIQRLTDSRGPKELTWHFPAFHQSHICIYTLGIATSAALVSLSRSRAWTHRVGTMPATADSLSGAPGPEVGGYCRVYGIARSLSCCSTMVWATRALVRWVSIEAVGEDQRRTCRI